MNGICTHISFAFLLRTEKTLSQVLNRDSRTCSGARTTLKPVISSIPVLNRFVVWISGSSYCPNQCMSTACQAGCDPSCCTPTSSSHQMQYPPPAVYGQPQATYPNQNPWQCPVACTRNVNFCPSYCSSNCCSSKRRSRVKIHRF